MKVCVLLLSVAVLTLTIAGCERRRGISALKVERPSVELTVYKYDFGEVKEIRPFDVVKGVNDLHIAEISNLIDPLTALYDWQDGFPAEVTSSTYDLGIGESADLMKRFEGKEVKMIWYGEDGREGSSRTGILEHSSSGQVVLRTNEGLLVNPTGTLIVPDESGIALRPSLAVRANVQKGGQGKLAVDYLTRGLSWSADYVAFVNPASDDMILECWASIDNRTGIAYPVKKLALAAGEPNRATRHRSAMKAFAKDETEGMAVATPADMAGEAIVPSEQGELYRYEVNGPSLISPNQLNRVKMIESKSVFIKRDYNIALPSINPYSDYEWSYRQRRQRQNAVLTLTFSNDKTSSLGMPLPAGAVRVYDVSEKGAKRFIGASGIGDTTENDKVNLTITNVFNVYSEFTCLETKRLDQKTVQKSYQITVFNKKDEQIGVRLVAPLGGLVSIVSESQKGVNLNSQQRQWTVDVPASGETKLTIVVKFRG